MWLPLLYTIYSIVSHFQGRGGANFRYFHDYPASHEIFHPRNFPHEFSVCYCKCAAQPGEYGVNRTHVLKGSNSYRNDSLSLSTPHRVRRHRSLTSAIHPSFHTHRSQQRGEESRSWGMTKEARHVPDVYRQGKGEGGNIRKHQRGSCCRQMLQ